MRIKRTAGVAISCLAVTAIAEPLKILAFGCGLHAARRKHPALFDGSIALQNILACIEDEKIA